MDRTALEAYMLATYHVAPDSPWDDPQSVVFRHAHNRRWFALVMNVPRAVFGLPGDARMDVVNLRCDPLWMGSMRTKPGIFPAYHMNKSYWLSVALDDTVPDDLLQFLLDMSFTLTQGKPKSKRPAPRL